jgi:hypothetical protein
MHDVKTSVRRHSGGKAVNAPGRPFDQITFGEKLADAIVTRRKKTARFISDEQLDGIFDECLKLRELGDISEAVETLGRLLDSAGFLAAAGNLAEFLDLFGWSLQDWNQTQGRAVDGAHPLSSKRRSSFIS